MKITSVRMSNFKGASEQYRLTGADVITGPNGTGKSRILQALQLALSGAVSHPIEERNIDLVEMFTKRPDVATMTVAIETDGEDLAEIEREFCLNRKNGKDSVTQSIGLVPMTVKGVTESERKIRELLGDFPYMLDFHKFIRLSDEKRAELVLQLSPIDEEAWNPETVRSRLTDAVPATGPAETVISAIPLVEGALKNLGGHVTSSSVAAMIAWLKAKDSELKKEIRGYYGASVASAQMNEVDGKKSLRHVEDIKSDIGIAVRQRDELVGAVAESRSTQAAVTRLSEERESLRRRIDLERQAATNEALQKARDEVSTLWSSIPSVNTAAVEVELARNAVQAAEREVDGCDYALTTQNEALQGIENKLAGFSQGVCPTCGSDVGTTVTGLREEHAAAENRLGVLTAALQLSRSSLEIRRGELSERMREHERIQGKVKEVQAAISKAERTVADLTARGESISVLESRLAELDHTNVDGRLINIEEAELQLEGIRTRIRSLEQELEEKQRYDVQIEIAKTTAVNAKRAEESAELVKALLHASTDIRWEIVRSALDPIKSEASELFSVMGYGDAVFDFQFTDSRGNEVFQFGWRISTPYGGMFVDFDSLSTAQQVFTLIAFLAPLIHRGSPRLRVMMIDNLEVVHEDFRPALMKLLAKIHGRFLDNVLVASSAEFPSAQGISIHELTGTVSHAA